MSIKTKKYIVRIFSIILFFTAICMSFVMITYGYRDKLSHSAANIAGFYAEKKNSLDVVVLGTSSTFSEFIPMDAYLNYGFTSYNLCTNLMLEESMKYYVKELYKYQNPKLIVVDIAPFIYRHTSKSVEENAIRYNVDAMRLSLNRKNLIDEIVPDKKSRLSYYFDLLFYHENRAMDLQYIFWKKENIYKGYNNLPLGSGYRKEDYVTTDEIITPDETEKANLYALMDELKKHESEVLFIFDPIGNAEGMTEYIKRANGFEQIIRENGFDFLNMTVHKNEIGLDEYLDYSVDFMHYHIFSAKKITNYLSKYIVENYDIPDHRGEKRYSGWDELESEWLEKRVNEEDFIYNYFIKSRFKNPNNVYSYFLGMNSEYITGAIWIPDNNLVFEDHILSICGDVYNRIMEAQEGYVVLEDCPENCLRLLDEAGNEIDEESENIILKSISIYKETGEVLDIMVWTTKGQYHY